MSKDYPGEEWKNVNFNEDLIHNFRLEVSNFGRLRTFNKVSDGNIVKGSMINGYRMIGVKLFRAREEQQQAQFNYMQQQVTQLSKKLKSLQADGESATTISETADLLASLKQNLSKAYRDDMKKRTVYFNSLVHRLVAEYFLPAPGEKQTLVSHLDHNKLNNRVANLKWMTPDENYAHQQNSPYVIREKAQRKHQPKEISKAGKLTVTKVMFLKKLLNEGKPVRQLAKQFKVTDTQIIRIRKGENWSEIDAAT